MRKTKATNLLLSNRFDILSKQTTQGSESGIETINHTDEDQGSHVGGANNSLNDKKKDPPIVVGANYYNKLQEVLASMNIHQYTLKFMSICIRLNILSESEYKHIVQALDQDANEIAPSRLHGTKIKPTI